MKNKENKNTSYFKRIYILSGILVAIFLLSIATALLLQHNSTKSTIAQIYVDGKLYTEIDLSSCDDKIITVINSANAVNTIEVKDHDIRMLSSDCKNQLCIHQGWAKKIAVPIVCLPNNIVITVTTHSDKENNSLDAVTY